MLVFMAAPHKAGDKALYLWEINSPSIPKTKNCADLNLGEDLRIFIPFCFPDSGIYLLNSFDFFL